MPDVVVAITGTGLVTPLGGSLRETMEALVGGQFIRQHAKVVPSHLDRARSDFPRVTKLAISAALEALGQAGGWREPGANPRTALVVGTSKGPIEQWLATPLALVGRSEIPYAPKGLHEVADSVASDLLPYATPRLTLSAACASGLHALIRGAMLLRAGEADRVLVVAAEASVHPLFVGSFKRLGVLAPEGHGCRPFDQHRGGFLMSEAAAAVCLEARAEPSRTIARVDRFGLGGDASHITGVDALGGTLRHVLATAIDRRPVDLLHAHGTGTPLNDPIELAAFEDLLPPWQGERTAFLYSHKGALGHSLGAAGLVSVVLNCEMGRRGLVLSNVQTRDPLPTRAVILGRDALPVTVRRSVAVASGFGGATAALSLTHSA